MISRLCRLMTLSLKTEEKNKCNVCITKMENTDQASSWHCFPRATLSVTDTVYDIWLLATITDHTNGLHSFWLQSSAFGTVVMRADVSPWRFEGKCRLRRGTKKKDSKSLNEIKTCIHPAPNLIVCFPPPLPQLIKDPAHPTGTRFLFLSYCTPRCKMLTINCRLLKQAFISSKSRFSFSLKTASHTLFH